MLHFPTKAEKSFANNYNQQVAADEQFNGFSSPYCPGFSSPYSPDTDCSYRSSRVNSWDSSYGLDSQDSNTPDIPEMLSGDSWVPGPPGLDRPCLDNVYAMKSSWNCSNGLNSQDHRDSLNSPDSAEGMDSLYALNGLNNWNDSNGVKDSADLNDACADFADFDALNDLEGLTDLDNADFPHMLWKHMENITSEEYNEDDLYDEDGVYIGPDDEFAEYTAVRFLGVPVKYTRAKVIKNLKKYGFLPDTHYDYLSLPRCNNYMKFNRGHFFVNFVSNDLRKKFLDVFDGRTMGAIFPDCPPKVADKVCKIHRSHIQDVLGNRQNMHHLLMPVFKDKRRHQV
jgi:hypothetical protein